MSGVHPNHSRAGERERKPLQEHYFLCRRESAGQLDRYQIGIYCEEETRPADQSLSIWCHQENAGKGRSTPHPSFVVRTRVHIDLAWLFYVWRLRTGYVGKKRKVIDFGTNYDRNRVPFSFGTFFWRDRACVQLSIGWHCVGGNKHFPKLSDIFAVLPKHTNMCWSIRHLSLIKPDNTAVLSTTVLSHLMAVSGYKCHVVSIQRDFSSWHTVAHQVF